MLKQGIINAKLGRDTTTAVSQLEWSPPPHPPPPPQKKKIQKQKQKTNSKATYGN